MYNFNLFNNREWNTLSFKWTLFVVEQWWCICKPHDRHDIMRWNEAILGRKNKLRVWINKTVSYITSLDNDFCATWYM